MDVIENLRRSPSEPIKGAPNTKPGKFEKLTGGNLSSPFSLARVIGNVTGEVAAKEYGYSPLMRAIMLQTEPALIPSAVLPSGAGARYLGSKDETGLVSPTPRILHHETMHGLWNRLSPNARDRFLRIAQRYATPENRELVRFKLGGTSGLRGLYSNTAPFPSDLRQADPVTADEMHSYLAESPQLLPPGLQQYYSPFFTDFDPEVQ